MKRRVLRAHANKRHLRHICASHALSPNNYNVIVDASFLRSVIQAYMSEYKVQVNTMSSHAPAARHATNRTGQKMELETNANSHNFNSSNDNFTPKQNRLYNFSSYSKTSNNHNQHDNLTSPCKISLYLIKLAEEAFGSLESAHTNAHAHEPSQFDEQERNNNNNSGNRFNTMHHRGNNKFNSSNSNIHRNNYHSMETDVRHKVKKLRIRFCVLECTKRVLLQMIAKHNNTVTLQRSTRANSQHHESKSKYNQFKLRRVIPEQLVEQLFRFLEVIKQSDGNDLFIDVKNLPSSLSKDANKDAEKHVKRISLPEEQNEVKAIALFMEFCNAQKRFGHNGAGEINDANKGKETIQSKINKHCAEKGQDNVNGSTQEHSRLLSQQRLSSSSSSPTAQFHLRTDIANPYDYFVATQSHDVRKHLRANTALLRFAFEPNCIWIEVNGDAYQYNTSSITGNNKLSGGGGAPSYKLNSNSEKLVNDVGRGVNTNSTEHSANEVPLFSAADLAFMQHLGKLPKYVSMKSDKTVVDNHGSAKQITQSESNTKNAKENFFSKKKVENENNSLWNAESKQKEKSSVPQLPLETASPYPSLSTAGAAVDDNDNTKVRNKRDENSEHVTKATVRSKRKRQSNPNPLSVKKKRKREVLRINA